MKNKPIKEYNEEDPKFYLVKNDTKLKEIIINYVGEQLHPMTPEVTVDDLVKIFADEFPEFLMVIANENFLRGYKQGLQDAEMHKKVDFSAPL
jgi:hypothetical protein